MSIELAQAEAAVALLENAYRAVAAAKGTPDFDGVAYYRLSGQLNAARRRRWDAQCAAGLTGQPVTDGSSATVNPTAAAVAAT